MNVSKEESPGSACAEIAQAVLPHGIVEAPPQPANIDSLQAVNSIRPPFKRGAPSWTESAIVE